MLATESPFPPYFDLDGTPLDSGYLYFGAAGLDPETNPASVYWDAAGLVPADQPIRTLNGRIVNGGTPSLVYANGDYSLRVRNSKGIDVYTALNSSVFGNSYALTQIVSQLGDSTTGNGDAKLSVNRSDVAGSSATTQHELNRGFPVIAGPLFGLVEGTGITGSQATANGTKLNAAISGGKSIKSKIQLPAGVIEYDGSLVAVNGGVVAGMGALGEETGVLFNGTTLKYRGADVAVMIVGTSPVGSRKQTSWRDLVIDGSLATSAATGVKVGWAMRSKGLLSDVTIANFGGHGLHFVDQLWNVSFDNLRFDNCGYRTGGNQSGIFKDASIDSGTWNNIVFNDTYVAGCGSASSTGGGICLLTTTANRGVYFNNLELETNSGTNQAFFQNLSDLMLNGMYCESVDIAGQRTGVEFSGCTGVVNGGTQKAANAATNLEGMRFGGGSDFNVMGVYSGGWGTAGIVNNGSKVWTARNFGMTFSSDSTAQWFGEYAPRVSAHKNGTDQTAVANNTFTKVTFPTERYDLTGCFASSAYTPKNIGLHDIDCQVTWKGATDGAELIIAIYLNGVLYKSKPHRASGGSAQAISISTQVDVNAVIDTIEVYVRQVTGSAQDISGQETETWFMASYLGRSA